MFKKRANNSQLVGNSQDRVIIDFHFIVNAILFQVVGHNNLYANSFYRYDIKGLVHTSNNNGFPTDLAMD